MLTAAIGLIAFLAIILFVFLMKTFMLNSDETYRESHPDNDTLDTDSFSDGDAGGDNGDGGD
jgi:hypothetical protein